VLVLVVGAVVVAWVAALGSLGQLGGAAGDAVDAGGRAPQAGPWQPTSTSTVLDAGAVAPPAQASPPPVVPAAPDPAWVERTAAVAGLPSRVLQAYATADLQLTAEQPACSLSWATLAGIGWVESHHGTVAGNSIGDAGRPAAGPIVGIPLTGQGATAQIRDTDGGALDGDTEWDRAVGAMQMLPATWARWGADGDGDGVLDPQDIDDAALAAGRYLCASASPLNDPGQWRAAVLAYNRSDAYAADVVNATNYYAERSRLPA